jgi:hypothetical protein
MAAQVLLLLTRNLATRARLVDGGAVPLLLQLMGSREDSDALLDCSTALTAFMLVSKTAEQAATGAMPMIGSATATGRRSAVGGNFSAAWSVQRMVQEGGGVALVLAKLREGEVYSHLSKEGDEKGEAQTLGLTINNDILAQVALLLAQMVANEDQLKAMSLTREAAGQRPTKGVVVGVVGVLVPPRWCQNDAQQGNKFLQNRQTNRNPTV